MTTNGLRNTLSALSVWISDAKADGTLSGLQLKVTLSTGETLTVTNDRRAVEEIAARDIDDSGIFWYRVGDSCLRQIAIEHIVMFEIESTGYVDTGELREAK